MRLAWCLWLTACAGPAHDAVAVAPVVVRPAQAPRPPDAGPPRLDHVVTLGQSSTPSRAPVSAVPAAPSMVQQTTVIVQPAPVYPGYGLFGPTTYWPSTGTRGSAPATNPGIPPVAGDWPKPPSYGPPSPWR